MAQGFRVRIDGLSMVVAVSTRANATGLAAMINAEYAGSPASVIADVVSNPRHEEMRDLLDTRLRRIRPRREAA